MSDNTPKDLPPLRHFDSSNNIELLEDMAADPDLSEFDLTFKAQLMEYGMRVRAIRKAAGLTQKQLANIAGLKQPKVSAIEAGTMKDGPGMRTMMRLSMALNAPDLARFDVVKKPKLFVEKGVLSDQGLLQKLANCVDGFLVHVPMPRYVVCHADPAGDLLVVAAAEVPRFEVGHAYVKIDGLARVISGGEGMAVVNATPNYLVLSEDENGMPFPVHVLG